MSYDPREILTPEEYAEALREAQDEGSQLTAEEEAVVQQWDAINLMRAQLDFFEQHPQCVPYVSTWLGLPNHVAYDKATSDDIADVDERSAENSRRRARAQAQALRAAGLKLEKNLDAVGDLQIKTEVTRNDRRFILSGWAYGYCKYVETEVKERVEVVEVPDEVAKAYTRIETRPIKERVCAPLMAKGEVEDL